jgi:hypothetical protein
MMVSEYDTHFMHLSLYAPNDMDTDKKKQECFLNGLDDGLAYALEARDFKNFQTMIDRALVLENRRGIVSSKCKQECHSQQSSNSMPHFGSSHTRPTFHPVQQTIQWMPPPVGRGFIIPQR